MHGVGQSAPRDLPLAPQAPLIALADEGVLREPAVRALVSASDREAYARNVEV